MAYDTGFFNCLNFFLEADTSFHEGCAYFIRENSWTPGICHAWGGGEALVAGPLKK